MPIDPIGLTEHVNRIFKSGEANLSVSVFIKVKVTLDSKEGGKLTVSGNRKSLIKHAYHLMTGALGVRPSLTIEVNDTQVLTHCGLGTSSSTIMAVASAINELYGHPITKQDLIRYTTGNHGEEVDNTQDDVLQSVPCIGGGASSGLVDGGIILISGAATVIAKYKYDSDILIGIPKKFEMKPNDELMKLEEQSFEDFRQLGIKYGKDIAFDFLHKIIPDLTDGNIKSLADMVFNYRFNMGVIESYALIYPEIQELANQLRGLYENKHCELLALSSVGPAFCALVNGPAQEKVCTDKMKQLGMDVIKTSINNDFYQIRKFV